MWLFSESKLRTKFDTINSEESASLNILHKNNLFISLISFLETLLPAKRIEELQINLVAIVIERYLAGAIVYFSPFQHSLDFELYVPIAFCANLFETGVLVRGLVAVHSPFRVARTEKVGSKAELGERPLHADIALAGIGLASFLAVHLVDVDDEPL